MDEYSNNISLNPFQLSVMLLKAKYKHLIAGRATGKSYINGAEIDENIRLMPRGITTITQDTLAQALTKTLPESLRYLEMLGYREYNDKTKTGDFVICRKPPLHFYLPYSRILSYEYLITFSNGHALYLLSQNGNSRGPNADYNITDEALTIDKAKYDAETSATRRGNQVVFGKFSPNPVYKHLGYTFTSSMGYLPEQKWLTEPAKYYQEERGINLFHIWNRIVNLQMQIIEAHINGDDKLKIELYRETQRLKKQITPFVSKEGMLFMLSNAFDNLHNLSFDYIINQYQSMGLMKFMIEIMNFYIDKVEDCYYMLDERHTYYNADNDDYVRGVFEDSNLNIKQLENQRHSLFDRDCNPNKELEITADWGSKIALIEVAQESSIDYSNGMLYPCDNNINEFFVKPDGINDTMINELIDNFCDYYRYHKRKVVVYYTDTYGDIRLASSRKTYNELAIERLQRHGWQVIQKKHAGKEPPQNDKYLLWQMILKEQEPLLPRKRFNAARCKYTLISMNNTSVLQKNDGKFEKDKSSERKKSILPEEATHFGDAVDKRVWTKYSSALKKQNFVYMPR